MLHSQYTQTDKLQGGQAPSALRIEGGGLVAGGGGGQVTLRGVSWPGFDMAAGFVAVPTLKGQQAAEGAAWEAADFVTSVHLLRLLGFNAVRLPFSFEHLHTPADVTQRCRSSSSSGPPDLLQLSRVAVDPGRAQQDSSLPSPPKLYSPSLPPAAGSSAGADPRCNGYVPRGPTALSRLLWTVEFLVRSGMYVVLDCQPQQELAGPAAFAAAWQRVAAALACLPAWRGDLVGRVLFGVLGGPAAAGLWWEGGSSSRTYSLGDYYLAALDAVSAVGDGEGDAFLFSLQGSSSGSSFTAGGASAFFSSLVTRPYWERVVLSPHLEGPGGGGSSAAAGPQLWEAMSTDW